MKNRQINLFASYLFCCLSGIMMSTVATASTVTPNKENYTLPLKEVQRFSNAISQIKKYYVEPVSDDKLFEDAIRGMLSGLDPHSAYLDVEDYKELQDLTIGEFGGLGIEVMLENGVLKVISPLQDMPAQKAGIKPGDLIVRINSAPIRGMSLREAVSKLRGKKGSKVTLTIIREHTDKPLTIVVTRDIIHIQSVKSQLLDKSYGYVRISNFQSGTARDLSKAIKSLEAQTNDKMKGLVIDLRNDPGGLLDSAVDVTNLFLESSRLHNYNRFIVYTKGRFPGSQFQAKANSSDMIKNAPIVVLVNEGSASGSEIVAGALQDYKRAVIVGTNSFGKGSVQTVLPIDDNTALKLTTALYYTPAGRSIQAKGIHPDVVVHEREPAPETYNKDKNSEYLKEADLKGHLANGNKNDDEIASEETHPNDIVSLKKDNQLHEALNILKGLSTLN